MQNYFEFYFIKTKKTRCQITDNELNIFSSNVEILQPTIV